MILPSSNVSNIDLAKLTLSDLVTLSKNFFDKSLDKSFNSSELIFLI